jgi:hypothetical protein
VLAFLNGAVLLFSIASTDARRKASTSIPSLCNVVVFVLEKTFVVLEGKLACANFPSLCNVVWEMLLSLC